MRKRLHPSANVNAETRTSGDEKKTKAKNKKARSKKQKYKKYTVAFHRLNFEDSFEYPHSSVILR
jgi:hypothetical protein